MTRRSRGLDFLRLVFALVVFLLSLLAVFPAPTYLAWELSVLVTEWGHILALVSLLVFLPGWKRSLLGRAAVILGGIAFVLALTPLVRAIPIARSLPAELRGSFGNVEPRSLSNASPRPQPVVLRDLVAGVSIPRVQAATLTYVVRDGKPLQMDLYRPLRHDSTLLPLVVMIHGGSWRGGSREDLPPLNRYLASRGYAVAAMSYRFAPRFPHPAASNDVHEAILFLKANARVLGVDPSRIALIGRSAGGQLGLLAAYTENDRSVRGAVGLYSPSDQVFGYENPSNPRVLNSTAILEAYLAGNPRTAAAAYISSSPINFVGPSTVPTLIIHGGNDELVWVRQSERLDARLTAAHRPHFLLRLPWATHGCDYNFSGPCGQLSTYAIERFLAAVMR